MRARDQLPVDPKDVQHHIVNMNGTMQEIVFTLRSKVRREKLESMDSVAEALAALQKKRLEEIATIGSDKENKLAQAEITIIVSAIAEALKIKTEVRKLYTENPASEAPVAPLKAEDDTGRTPTDKLVAKVGRTMGPADVDLREKLMKDMPPIGNPEYQSVNGLRGLLEITVHNLQRKVEKERLESEEDLPKLFGAVFAGWRARPPENAGRKSLRETTLPMTSRKCA